MDLISILHRVRGASIFDRLRVRLVLQGTRRTDELDFVGRW